MSDEVVNEEVKAPAGANGRAVPRHSTDVEMNRAWDRTTEVRKMRSPATRAYYDRLFAYQLPNTEGDRKTHYSFVHHYVGEDGQPGPASMRALSNAIAVLNGGRSGTVLRGAAREGVYRHIAAHYSGADREAPELKSDEDVDAVMMYKGLIDAPLSETEELTVKGLEDLNNIIDAESSVIWMDGDIEAKGVVIEADEDTALVEEINEKGERTGEFHELDYAELKLRTFVITEKVDGMAEAGSVVSWNTSQGKFYGDVVAVETNGTLRGEPQGLELEGTEENPVYLIRVWMQESYEEEDGGEEEDMPEEDSVMTRKSEGEWHPTNVTVVARGDSLTVEEALPTGTAEEDYDEEEDNEETPMKSINDDLRVKLAELIKANTEILAALVEDKVEEKTEVTESVEAATEQTEEVKAEDADAVEAAIEAADEVKADEVVAEEVKADEVATEEVVETTEEVKSDDTPVATTEETVEQKASISFEDLKEFHNLLKEINNQ